MKINKIIVFHSKNNRETINAIDSVKEWASDRNIKLELFHLKGDRENPSIDKKRGLLAVSVGGDGTFLRAADIIVGKSVPLLGINVGSLGFLTFLTSKDIYDGLTSVSEDRFNKRKLLRLKCVLFKEGKEERELSALNEISITRREVTGFTELDLIVNGEMAGTYAGDGIIVTTPTGSTAHSLSCGGPIILPSTKTIGVVPMNTHQLTARPFVCPDVSEIIISPKTRAALLSDGDLVRPVNSKNEIKITKSKETTEILTPPGKDKFFSTLRNKLNWIKNENRKND